MGEAGKGDKQRPTDTEKYTQNYDLIFRKDKEFKAIDELVRLSEELGLYKDLEK